MIASGEYNQELEDRLRQVEVAVVELSTMARMMKGILFILCASLGIDLTGAV